MFGLPFFPFQNRLYSPNDLFAGFDPDVPASIETTLDLQIYRFFVQSGRGAPRDAVAAAEAVHDAGITSATKQLLSANPRVVAIMGGHSLQRNDPVYASVASLAKSMSEAGMLVASG